jgi:probable F420-dependent oxidoreductase
MVDWGPGTGDRVKFALYLPPFGDFADPLTLVSLAQEAESAGWDGFFLWDHVALEWPGPLVDPWIALAAVAAQTTSLRLGPLVTPLPRRRPWKVAREAVSLDYLSGGRAVLGVGLGILAEEFQNLGDEGDLKIRAEMLDEGLQALVGLWSGEPFSFEGRHYRIQEAQFLPRPLQSPRIPIWVAGLWPAKAPFRRAARWDGVFPLYQPDLMQDLSPQQVREIAAYIGEQRSSDEPFDILQRGTTPGEDRAQDLESIAAYEEAGATWWLENIHPWRFGWQGQGAWPLGAIRDYILQGPARE